MSFEHPLFAVGALAALLPLAVHLLHRRRSQSLPFAAIDFLLRSRQVRIHRLRLKRWLLMATRMLLLVAIPLALAKPHRRAAALPMASDGTTRPAATVLLLDASASMRYRRDGKTLFSYAQSTARQKLAELAPQEPVTIQLCSAGAGPPSAPGYNRGEQRTAIDSARASEEPVDIAACLEGAAASLSQTEMPRKRIFVFSDLTSNNWDLRRPAPQISTTEGLSKPEVEVVDVAGGDLPNHSLSDLTVEPAPSVGLHGYRFSFLVHNYSARAVSDLPVTLKVGQTIITQGFCDLAPWGTQRKVLAANLDPGTIVIGHIRLPEDALPDDDDLTFALNVPRPIHVLLVDGAASSLRYLDEAFFVQTALEASTDTTSSRLVDPETLVPAQLDEGLVDVILLLNVRALSKEKSAALHRFVDRGGGLFISLGDRVDPDVFNESLGSLLPAALRLVKTAAAPSQESGPVVRGTTAPTSLSVTGQVPSHFARIDFTSPVFSLFEGSARQGLLETRVFRYVLVEPPVAGTSILATYDDGAPALLWTRHGSGRVALFTSSVAREWTDWPIRSSFVPVLQRLVRALSGLPEPRPELPTLVGSRRIFKQSDLAPVATVSPSGVEQPLEKEASAEWRSQNLHEIGAFRVKAKDRDGKTSEVAGLAFSVTFDPRESDTRRLSMQEISAHYGARLASPSGLAGDQSRLPLWTQFLLGVVAFFAAEGWLLG